ncbi:hypothetical protein SSYRP_v1c00660 [Spiroplasma syrphidicola EA-1]|uniref:Uncharacterized protein n=1 Tax=Spiroplasma syrphidicola EA-1 TaxID=1276229 RepID=R4U2R9_9MOLU|nr:hypothetical protein [Spiroplasma syrphidicola]AGM25662.1 hypothetical protein SSYRP_v1c00660 [Spiroplasma syrphidicola EA-1]
MAKENQIIKKDTNNLDSYIICLKIRLSDEKLQNKDKIYERVKYGWKLSKNKYKKIKFVFAINIRDSKVIGSYKVCSWDEEHSNDQKENLRKYFKKSDEDLKCNFFGKDVKTIYGKGRNPIRYVKCQYCNKFIAEKDILAKQFNFEKPSCIKCFVSKAD